MISLPKKEKEKKRNAVEQYKYVMISSFVPY